MPRRSPTRLLTVATWLSLGVAMGFGVLWIVSYFTDLHVGTWTRWVALDRSVYHERAGVFVGRGQLAYARDYAGEDFYAGNLDLTKLTLHADGPTRWGVFVGDFGWWYHEKDEDFILGMGSNDAAPYVSVGLWWAILVCLVLPVVGWMTRVGKWNAWQAAHVAVVAYGVLAAMAVVPALTVLVVLGIVPFASVMAILSAINRWHSARVRQRQGRCRVCGYDLRATPDPNGPRLERCPECGTYSSAIGHRSV